MYNIAGTTMTTCRVFNKVIMTMMISVEVFAATIVVISITVIKAINTQIMIADTDATKGGH